LAGSRRQDTAAAAAAVVVVGEEDPDIGIAGVVGIRSQPGCSDAGPERPEAGRRGLDVVDRRDPRFRTVRSRRLWEYV
jgi:hypothetical protein